MPGTIVLGYDGSECAGAALDTAVSLASQYGDRLLIVFGSAPPGVPSQEDSVHRAAIEEVGERVTGEALQRARDAGLEVDIEIAPRRPHEAIVAAAAEHDARFIVVGSYGESPIRGALLGSVPHKLLAAADTPVVVVRD